MGYKSKTQTKNYCWYLPRPKPDHYKGGMPLYCEEWLLELAKDILYTDEISVLNLFCGMNSYGFRVDLNPEVKPDLLCDVHNLTTYHQELYDVILADPPYSNQESKDIYGTPNLKYSLWTSEASQCLKSNGLFIIYHERLVKNPNPLEYSLDAQVAVINRINHPVRVARYFRKK